MNKHKELYLVKYQMNAIIWQTLTMQNIVIIGVTSGKIKKENACAECANAKWKKKGLARGAQGRFKTKTCLLKTGKSELR